MIKAVIVEDNPMSLMALKDLLADNFPEINVVAECASAAEAEKVIKQQKPDLIFLDVELPDKSGVEMLDKMENVTFGVVFTTSHEKYALHAIRMSAVDFLLKPFGENDIRQALTRFEKKKSTEQLPEKIDGLFKNLSRRINPDKKISIPTSNGLEFIRISQVVRLQADVNYTNLFMSDKRKILVSRTLKQFESLLIPFGFCRIHNSHIINLKFIKSYNKGNGGVVTMDDGSEIDVSRGYKAAFLEAIDAE
jgi:two-component system, LytTR family, response regulator